MAGKPALAPGFVLGYLVNNAVVTPNGNSVSTGFLGAMIMAVICGYFVRWMKTWKVNNTIQTIMPILIIPILTSLVLGMAYIYILATPLGFVMDWLTGVLGSLQGGSAVVLGLVIGVMTAFDMGGPINKTASTFTMAIMASGIYGPNGMFRVAVAVPPIACGLAALIAKNKFDDADRQMGISALFMGCIGITEGAIPFAVKDPRSHPARHLHRLCRGCGTCRLPGHRLLRPARWLYRRPCHQQRRAVLPGHRDWRRGRRCNPDCHEAHAR